MLLVCIICTFICFPFFFCPEVSLMKELEVSLFQLEAILLRLCAAQDCGVSSLVDGTAVLLMLCPLLVRSEIWNVFRVPAIAH